MIALKRADIFFMIDTSISMQSIIDNVRETLRTEIIPGVTSLIEDVQIGAGQFDVCPAARRHPYGSCTGIRLESPLGSTIDDVERGLSRMTADCHPVHEPYAQAAWLFATGDRTPFGDSIAPSGCADGMLGFGCARPDALPILVMIGDEPFGESYETAGNVCAAGACASCARAPSPDEVAAALSGIHARLIVYGGTASSPEWASIALATRSVDQTGAPLVFPTGDDVSQAGPAVTSAIQRLARQAPLDVTTRLVDEDPADGVDPALFVDRIVPVERGGAKDPAVPGQVCVGGLSVADTGGDGVADTFVGVAGGSPVCFDIYPRPNEIVRPRSADQVFTATLEIVADQITVLDRRRIVFVVPSEERPTVE